ncbi:MAG: PQQ-binding-like beta-propeller repeat protein [Planctomycetes bacterium]|nr:PQQ-binding-like beta-propeller repeat protein [Planctomycetota bacterium]
MRCCLLLLTLLAGAAASPVSAQVLRVVAPAGGVLPQSKPDEDLGVPVELFESPQLDRYLRRAQTFLEQAKYDAAIQVLQEVLEGRTAEFVGPGQPGSAEGRDAKAGDAKAGDAKAGDPKAGDPKPAEAKAGDAKAEVPAAETKPDAAKGRQRGSGESAKAVDRRRVEPDASAAVFSQDGRLYRPVRRLVHEILATLPAAGLEFYRASYEAPANEMLAAAQRDGSLRAYEQVVQRYFVTTASGKAMQVLADRFMQEGRHRAAVQVLRDLIGVYPAEHRKKLGISEVWCRFKIALCLRLAGEVAAARAAVEELAAAFPDESLRLAGELQTMRDLPQSDVFAAEVLAILGQPRTAAVGSWLAPETEALVPLWQFRFRNPDPYRDPKGGNGANEMFWSEGVQTAGMPFGGRYGPGTRVQFLGGADRTGRVLFLEHFRLRVAAATSGLLLGESDGSDDPPQPRENAPRARIAAVDHALLRPVEDEARLYVVTGFPRSSLSQSADVLKTTELVAYQRDSLARVWSSAQWFDGEDGLRDVTFLAAPTVFGERLLLPAQRRGAYTLQCLDRQTGRPLWHTLLHMGGTPFFKAPGVPVVVSAGIAFVATNAGCLAAVDAFAGELRWLRRYEREDPARPRPRSRSKGRADGMVMVSSSGMQFSQAELPGFWPNELMVGDGLVVVAPCDGAALLCFDAATGQPAWWLDGATKYAPYGVLRTLVGASSDSLFALADRHLVCIARNGGLVRWAKELPAWNGLRNTGRGRGAVVGDWVVLPGERELLVFDTAGRQSMRRLPLPQFDGREPLAGSYHIAAFGPWLALGYAGGVELFSSADALRAMAGQSTDPLERADCLQRAGDVAAAEQVLTAGLAVPVLAAERRQALALRLLSLVRARALAAARNGGLDLGVFEPLRSLGDDPAVRRQWHLARLEVCKAAGDLRAYEQEQQRLYAYLEGKGQ